MKKSYTVPAAELIYLLPQENLASSWIWGTEKSNLANLWGANTDKLASANVNWYDITTSEFNK